MSGREQETRPGPAGARARVSSEFTCNHFLAAPRIAPEDGAIHSFNVLHRGFGGLVSWAGSADFTTGADPLLRVRFSADGGELTPGDLRWDRIDRWLPRWRAAVGDVQVTCTLCLPGGGDAAFRGGVLAVELSNRGRSDRNVDVSLEGAWRVAALTVATTRALAMPLRLVRGAGSQGIALEIGSGAASVALAFAGDHGSTYVAAAGDAARAGVAPGAELVAAENQPLRFTISRSVRVRAGRAVTIAFYIGAAPERDGALATAARLAVMGADEIIRLARLDLARLSRRVADAATAAILNRNLLFACYAGVARAIDDDRLYFLRSRSPAHGACAAFNEREALLWLVPALTAADPMLAREALIRAFEQYAHRAGEHMRYLDGGVLAPGFSLAQFCAYAVALDRYATEARDTVVLDDPLVQDVLRELDEWLFHRLDPEHFICSGDLLPSGEPADYPYLSFDNALVWRYADSLPRIWRRQQGDAPPRFENAGEEVAATIWHRCTVDVEGMRVLGYASDLRGGIAIYDDPAGSLRLLPHIGFCEPDDPIWANTMDLLHSATYPLWLRGRNHAGFAGRSTPGIAAFAALCSDLLTSRRDEAMQIIRALDLDAGIAAEGYDPDTGRVAAGPLSAPLAGFLAWAMLTGPDAAAPAAEKRRRRA
jgi:hypothetical protein